MAESVNTEERKSKGRRGGSDEGSCGRKSGEAGERHHNENVTDRAGRIKLPAVMSISGETKGGGRDATETHKVATAERDREKREEKKGSKNGIRTTQMNVLQKKNKPLPNESGRRCCQQDLIDCRV